MASTKLKCRVPQYCRHLFQIDSHYSNEFEGVDVPLVRTNGYNYS